MGESTRNWLAMAALLAMSLAMPVARADIYSYLDGDGITHFSNVPADGRYTLVIKSPPEESTEAARPEAISSWRLRAAAYAALIDRTAARTALQPALLRAVIAVESAFNPRAVSRAGAQGLMQLQPATARRYGVGDAFDPEQNVAAGARYLRDLLRRYDNNLELALAAYNAGEEAVERHGRQIPPYRETQQYVPAVLRLYRQLLMQRT